MTGLEAGEQMDMKIGVVGCAGRMGRALIQQIHDTEGCRLAGASERPASDAVGRDPGELAGIGPTGLTVSGESAPLFAVSDAVLDFTAPAASVIHAGLAAEHGAVHVIGTTGFDAAQDRAIEVAATRAVIVRAGNMSLGVNLLVALTRKLAAILNPDFDIEVVEMHHRHKVDAPSGTALMLGRAAAAGRDVDHDAVADRGRDGITGPRQRGHIGYAVLRGGNVVGEHSVIFAADDERIELTHKAGDRSIFARGAVTAALWGRGRKPGLYSMANVLGLED